MSTTMMVASWCFSVSGTIELTSGLTITADNLTLAGQSAPAGGITITGEKVLFDNANNVVVRYLRFRPDYEAGGNDNEDGARFYDCDDLVVDHCSFSWGRDEVVSTTGMTHRVSWQRNLIAEGKTGTLFGDSNYPEWSEDLSFHRNLFYNITHRFPNVNSDGRVDVVNNVVFNWKFRLSSVLGDVELNHINNYYAQGCADNPDDELNKIDFVEGATQEVFTAGNLIMPSYFTDSAADNWPLWEWFTMLTSGPYAGAEAGGPASTDFQVGAAFQMLGRAFTIASAPDAYADVAADVGANARLDENGNTVPASDNLDTMFLNNVLADSCVPYDSSSTYQDYPTTQHYLDFHAAVSDAPLATGFADSNSDGIPDAWKVARGRAVDADLTTYVWPSGYVGIEEFLNEIDSP